ncbi:MAG TPA: hypothetical protein VJ756_00555 [Terriglobales bacterium]|nr:hypothetical protein [Terriglobales bacterium]
MSSSLVGWPQTSTSSPFSLQQPDEVPEVGQQDRRRQQQYLLAPAPGEQVHVPNCQEAWPETTPLGDLEPVSLPSWINCSATMYILQAGPEARAPQLA